MERVGPYEIRDELGRGGMGVVYRAYHPALGREVALKIIRPDLLGEDDADVVARFQREAQAAARLADVPGIVAVRDLGESDGRLYLAMDLVRGRSFDELIYDGDVGPSLAAGVIEQAARAVHQAHEAGILHRDLKPANLLVTEGGDAFVTDFGLAGLTRLGEDARKLTASNLLIGTPAYMSPEQAATGSVDGTADVWALGVTLYEALCERTPFQGDTTLAVLTGLLHEEPPPPHRFAPDVPPSLEAIVMKCLRRDAAERYPTALALAEDCARFRRGEPPLARPAGTLGSLGKGTRRHRRALFVAAGMAAAAGLLGGAAWWGSRTQETQTAEAAVRGEEARAAETLAARAKAFRAIEAAARDHFAVLEDRVQQGELFRGDAAAARAGVLAVLDARPVDEAPSGLRAWRTYLAVLDGSAAAAELRALADADPADPVSRLLLARATLLPYAASVRLPQALFATSSSEAVTAAELDSETSAAMREASVRALSEASRTPLWPQLSHGPEALAMLAALEAVPHGDWAVVAEGLRAARDDPWWGLLAELLTGYALAADRRFGAAADVLEPLARRRRWTGLLVTAGDVRLHAARKANNAGRPAEAIFEQAVTALADAAAAASGASNAAVLRATGRIELAALRAQGGADPRPAMDLVLEELAAARPLVAHPAALYLPAARAWLVRAQASLPRGEDPRPAVKACIAACRSHAEAEAAGELLPRDPRVVAEQEEVSHLYRANAASAAAAWEAGTGRDNSQWLQFAQRMLDRVLEKSPGHAVARNDRGTVRLQLAMHLAVRGRDPLELLGESAADFEAASAAEPGWAGPVANLTDVYLLRAQWLAATGQDAAAPFKQAVAQVTLALAADPKNAMFHSRRGVIRSHLATHLRKRGRPVGDLPALAQDDFRNALAIQSDFVEALQGLAELLLAHVIAELDAGNIPTAAAADAVERLRRAAALQPGSPAILGPLARAHFQRGRVAVAAGEDPAPHDAAALRIFDALVRGVPNQPTYWLLRSYARLSWGLRAQAGGEPGTAHLTACLADLDRALALNPRLPEALHRKGLALSGLGRHRDAIAALEAALALDPAYPGSAPALARARQALAAEERR